MAVHTEHTFCLHLSQVYTTVTHTNAKKWYGIRPRHWVKGLFTHSVSVKAAMALAMLLSLNPV